MSRQSGAIIVDNVSEVVQERLREKDESTNGRRSGNTSKCGLLGTSDFTRILRKSSTAVRVAP